MKLNKQNKLNTFSQNVNSIKKCFCDIRSVQIRGGHKFIGPRLYKHYFGPLSHNFKGAGRPKYIFRSNIGTNCMMAKLLEGPHKRPCWAGFGPWAALCPPLVQIEVLSLRTKVSKPFSAPGSLPNSLKNFAMRWLNIVLDQRFPTFFYSRTPKQKK